MGLRRGILPALGAALIAALVAACGSGSQATPSQPARVLTLSPVIIEPDVTVGALSDVTLSAIFSGPADDGDFNTLGAAALAAAADLDE